MGDCSGLISQLFIYPIKSCAGIEVDQAELKATGLAMDREWVIIDQHGLFITQRQSPHMAWIKPSINTTSLTLNCPTQESIDIPLDFRGKELAATVWRDTVTSEDMGDDVARWLDRFLQIPGRNFRLVRFGRHAQRLSNKEWTGDIDAPNMFSDGFACLVVTQSALDELNRRLKIQGFPSVGMERFRPNIVLSELAAHDEDHLDYLHFDNVLEGSQLQLVKPCSRCAIPDIDPYSAQITPEVNQTLGTYRRLNYLNDAICFGMNAIVTRVHPAPLKKQMRFHGDFKI